MGNSSDGLLPKHSADIIAIDRLITTICEHIVPVKSLPRGSIAVRIDKPSPDRVIVPAAEVVEPRLGVVDVPAVAQGIHSTQRGGHSAAGGHGRAPGIVGVGHHLGAAGIDKTGDIALGIFQVEILDAVIRHGRRPQAVVGEVHPVAAPGQVRQLGYLFLLVGFLILQVGRYFPAPQAFKLHAFLARQ